MERRFPRPAQRIWASRARPPPGPFAGRPRYAVSSWGANRTRRDGGNDGNDPVAEISECATWDDGAATLSIRDEGFAATGCVGPQLRREQLQAPPHKHSDKFR